ncbi:MAG: cation:proton antiporter, partial [Bacilli bacterium]|nr:cation:proton antiporter [Bacilli bacterium]
MNIFLSSFIIFGGGILGGFLFEKIKLPKLVWYIILGILIGPSLFNIVDDTLLSISSHLRQIALVIILTRSGLSLDIKSLKKIGRPAILMCFLPACFEIAGITIFAPMLLGISYFEALLLGSVLAAVSPAVVVPRMIRLMEEGYGKEHCVPELVMAGASCDDIFVIVLFYSF